MILHTPTPKPEDPDILSFVSGLAGRHITLPHEMIERLLRFWEWPVDILATQGRKERKAKAVALGRLAVVNALPADQALPFDRPCSQVT